MSAVTYPDFELAPDRAFTMLWNELHWEKREDAPRRECWMATRPYTYGKGRGERSYLPHPKHPLVTAYEKRIYDQWGYVLDGCFANGYANNRDHLGWHSDDDSGIDHSQPIAILSVGAEREIWFRPLIVESVYYKEPNLPDIEKLVLTNGSITFMPAGMQQTHQHRIPKASYECGPRVSLTFRGML